MVSPNGAQGSIYNPCSFHEVQSQIGNQGKPAVNLSELVKNVVSSGEPEDAHNLQNPSSSSSSSSSLPSASYFLGNYINRNGKLSKKTIDEVWKEIVHQKHLNEVDNQSLQQQLTVGETTLEDFLLRAGVINTGNNSNNQNDAVNHHDHHHQPLMAIDPMVVVSSQHADWLHFQMAAAQHHYHDRHDQMTLIDPSFNVSESVYEDPVADNIGYSAENQLALTMPAPAAIPAAPSDSKFITNERKRRYSDEIMEKTIERRQKRMIKNRESAARSRARKQAYTNQLESKVLWLRETNSKLKKHKEVEMMLSSYPIPIPKYSLRRTSTI